MPKVREGDHGETYVFSRAEDRSVWVHISYLMDKYKILLWAVGWFLLAAGFGFRTPAQDRADTKADMDSIKTRVGRQEKFLEATQRDLSTLVTLRCLDVRTEMSKAVLDASGLDCSKAGKK